MRQINKIWWQICVQSVHHSSSWFFEYFYNSDLIPFVLIYFHCWRFLIQSKNLQGFQLYQCVKFSLKYAKIIFKLISDDAKKLNGFFWKFFILEFSRKFYKISKIFWASGKTCTTFKHQNYVSKRSLYVFLCKNFFLVTCHNGLSF